MNDSTTPTRDATGAAGTEPRTAELPNSAAAGIDQRTHDLVAMLSELSLPLMWALRQQAVRAFEPLGLRPVKALLVELLAHGPQHPKELSELLDATAPAISALLSELENDGLVHRSIDPTDRRRILLELTDGGHDLRRRMGEAWCAAMLRRAGTLTHDELESLVDIYRKLAANP